MGFNSGFKGLKLSYHIWPEYWFTQFLSFTRVVMPWPKRLVAGLAARGPNTFPGLSMWYLWWARRQWYRFISEYFFSPVSTVPPMLRTHSFIYHSVTKHHKNCGCRYLDTILYVTWYSQAFRRNDLSWSSVISKSWTYWHCEFWYGVTQLHIPE